VAYQALAKDICRTLFLLGSLYIRWCVKAVIRTLALLLACIIGLYLMFQMAYAQWVWESASFANKLPPFSIFGRLAAILDVLFANWVVVLVGIAASVIGQGGDD
jgi:ABC-type proline/glycine betaine transport system permease subunit